MAKKEKAKSMDGSQHVFNSRFSRDMPCPLVNFYPSAPNVPFHIPSETIKVHSFRANWEHCALMGKTN